MHESKNNMCSNCQLQFIILNIDTFSVYHNKHFPQNLFVQKFSCSVAESWFHNNYFFVKITDQNLISVKSRIYLKVLWTTIGD